MSFFTDIPGAFRDGVLNASSRKSKILRLTVLSVFWLVALACIVLAVVTFSTGFPLPGVTFTLNIFTYLFLSIAFIYNCATAESLRV